MAAALEPLLTTIRKNGILKIDIKQSHWLNRSMDIALTKFADGFAGAVSITGVDYVDNGRGGREALVRYAARLMDADGREYLSRPIAPGVVPKALASGEDVLEAAASSFQSGDGAALPGQLSGELFARLERALLSATESSLAAVKRRRGGI